MIPFLSALLGLDHSNKIELELRLWQWTFSGGPDGAETKKGRGHFQYGLNRTLLAVGKPPESQKRGLQLRKTQYIFSLDLFLLVVKREGKYLGRFCVSKQPYNTTDLSKQKYAFCLASVFFFSFQIVSFGYKEVLMADNKITTRRNIISCIFLFSKMRGR